MIFTVERVRLVKMLDLVRDDKAKRAKRGKEEAPYLRIATENTGMVCLAGLNVEASFAAAIHEPGVVFLKAELFPNLVATMTADRLITVAANAKDLTFGDVTMLMGKADILLYPDPATAPQQHPGDRQRAMGAVEQKIVNAMVARDRLPQSSRSSRQAHRPGFDL